MTITAVCPTEGRKRLLEIDTGQKTPNYAWALFTTNTTPAAGTTYAGLTEATFNGYARQVYGPGAIGTDGSTPANATETDTTVSFVAGVSIAGPQSIYVAALVDQNVPERILFAWAPTGVPFIMTNPGDTYTFTCTELLGAMA